MNEGVHIGAYEKRMLEIEVACRPVALVGRDVKQILGDSDLSKMRAVVPSLGNNETTTVAGSTTSTKNSVCFSS
jgi:hypothetical protein